MKTFSTQLKKIRKDRKLRQADLAGAIGVAQTTIANYEQGIRFPDEATLVKIADYFRISIDYLLGRDNTLLATESFDNYSSIKLSDENHKILKYLLANEEMKARGKINKLIEEGQEVKNIYTTSIQQILYYVGSLWENGTLDVFQEHLVAESMQRLMADIMSGIPGSSSGPSFIGLSVSGELHEIGIRMITDIFRIEGWNAVYLGTSLPALSIMSAIEKYNPRVIGISVAIATHIETCKNIIQRLRTEFKENCPAVIVGGQAFSGTNDSWRQCGADYYAKDAVEAAILAKELKKKKAEKI